MNQKLLKAKMILEGFTQNDLADLLGITTVALSYKMNGIREFKRSEIFKIFKALHLTAEELIAIFFAE